MPSVLETVKLRETASATTIPSHAILSEPVLFVEIYLTKFPASLGTKTLRLTRSQRPRSLPGAYYEPRIKSVSSIIRSATDPDGNYQIGSMTLTIDDSDSELAALLAENAPTEYFAAREVAVWIISKDGLDSGLTPATVTPIHRGWISDSQKKRRDVTITSSDVLGSQMSGFNLDKKALQIQVKHLTDGAREENKEKYLPILIGEFSDVGSPPADDGSSTEKGLVPVVEVCEININDLTNTTPPIQPQAQPPIVTGSGVVGATGEHTYYYAATLITSFGESGLSNIVALSGAANRNLSNYNWFEGTYDNGGSSPFNKVRIWRSESADPTSFHLWLDEAGYTLPGPGTWGYADGAAPVQLAGGGGVTRDELDDPKEGTPGVGGAPADTGIWSIMALCLGYAYDFIDIRGSDLADGVEPKRAILPDSDYGVTTIRPTDSQWPFPDPWIELNGIIFTGFLQRGNKLNAHRDGSVTMAANICGPNIGGVLLNQAFYQRQFLLNEYCLKNKGTGWRNQTYGTLETFNNGDPVLKTSSYAACQDMTIGWIGGLGYIGCIWVVDSNETWRDVSRKFFLTYGARESSNRFGQIVSILINTIDDGILGRHFRERIEIKRSEEPRLAHDEIINQFTWNYFYDQDAAAFRGRNFLTNNLESIAAHVPGGVVGGSDLRGLRPSTRDLAYTNDATTANDSINRELTRRGKRPRYPVETVGMLGLDYDIGDRARITDTEGLGESGDISTRCIILTHETNIDEQEVTLTFQVLITPLGVSLIENVHVQDNFLQVTRYPLQETVTVSEALSLVLTPFPATVPDETVHVADSAPSATILTVDILTVSGFDESTHVSEDNPPSVTKGITKTETLKLSQTVVARRDGNVGTISETLKLTDTVTATLV